MAKTTHAAHLLPAFLPPAGGFAVRMYRQGLGDCFLVAVAQPETDRPFFMLFDCGVHARQAEGPKRLLEVMRDIEIATGGEIDVLIGTHQHADHLSGFVQKGNPFVGGRINVKSFWVAWTEKPGDTRAEELRKKHGAARDAIKAAIEKLKGRDNAGLAERLGGLMDFEHVADDFEVDPALQVKPAGAAAVATTKPKKDSRRKSAAESDDDEATGKGSKAKVSSMELALNFLADSAGEVHFCEPGESLPLGNIPNARAYVLGPPRGDLIKRDLPTGGNESERRETYLAGGASQQGFLLAPALGWAEPFRNDSALTEDLCHPFDYSLRRPFTETGVSIDPIQWKDERKTPTATREFYENNYFKGSDWRRIDADWFGAAEQLALDLDSDTNNTSLVLALEFGDPGEGKVALFVGDAQVGNWLSWTDQSYKSGSHSLTIEDLLSRTILYKVGHHGSHNATLKRDSRHPSASDRLGSPYGLELMPSTLVAMIPVDRAAAEKNMPIPWHMPHPPLYESLLRKTAGRVLRADGLDPEPGVKGPPALNPPKGGVLAKIPGLSDAFWREAATKFKDGANTRTCPLYYDVFFGGRPPK